MIMPVSLTICQTFACEDLGDGAGYLVVDPALRCSTKAHKVATYEMWRIYAGCFFGVYTIGVPLILFVVLYANRKLIKKIMHRRRTDEIENRTQLTCAHRSIENVSRREPSIAAHRDGAVLPLLLAISHLFNKYDGSKWWFGVASIAVRLCQTSLVSAKRDPAMCYLLIAANARRAAGVCPETLCQDGLGDFRVGMLAHSAVGRQTLADGAHARASCVEKPDDRLTRGRVRAGRRELSRKACTNCAVRVAIRAPRA